MNLGLSLVKSLYCRSKHGVLPGYAPLEKNLKSETLRM